MTVEEESDSSDLDVNEIEELREKAKEKERKHGASVKRSRRPKAKKATSKKKAPPQTPEAAEYGRSVKSYWQDEFQRESVSNMNVPPNDNDNPSQQDYDADAKAKEGATAASAIGKPVRRKAKKAKSNASLKDDKNGKSKGKKEAAAALSSGEGVRRAEANKPTPPTPPPPTTTSASQHPGSDNNLTASMPGAYAHEGPGVEDALHPPRRDSAVEEVLAAMGQLEENNVVADDDVEQAEESANGLVKAEIVDDAETIFEAEDVKHDRFRRNMMVTAFCCILVCATVVTLLVILLDENEEEKKNCDLPVDQQSVPLRCNCSGTTGDFYETLGDVGLKAYKKEMDRLISKEILDENATLDYEMCDPLNQNLLVRANMTEQSELGGDFLNLASPTNRWTMFTLLHIYITMGGISWENRDDWLTDEMCSWFGVTCLYLDIVEKFVVPENGLTGTLPTYLGLLESIRTMDLSDNDAITGTLPSEIGDMTALQVLVLSRLSLTGEIPTELGSLPKLDELDLSFNQLTGSIPMTLYDVKNLRFLRLSNNELKGSLPSEIRKLSRLIELDLGGNILSGNLPEEMGELTHLEKLSINNNTFQGTIPDFLGQLPHLDLLFLQGSGFTGGIPETFCNSSLRPLQPLRRKLVVDCGPSPPSCTCCSEEDKSATVNVICFTGVENEN